MNSLKYSPFLIKPNIEELSGIFNTEVTKQNVNIYAEKLISLGAQHAFISMGGDGAYLSCSDGKGLYMPAVSGTAVNTVGAGDSMLAGFLAGYEKTKDSGYALRLGTAVAALRHSAKGWQPVLKFGMRNYPLQNNKCGVTAANFF